MKREQSTGDREIPTTDGLKGGWIFFNHNFLKSMCLAKKGCDLISCAPFTPNLLAGSRLSKPVRSERASAPTSSGKRSGSERILRYISFVFSS